MTHATLALSTATPASDLIGAATVWLSLAVYIGDADEPVLVHMINEYHTSGTYLRFVSRDARFAERGIVIPSFANVVDVPELFDTLTHEFTRLVNN